MPWGKWRLAWRIVSVCGLNLLVAWLFLVGQPRLGRIPKINSQYIFSYLTRLLVYCYSVNVEPIRLRSLK